MSVLSLMEGRLPPGFRFHPKDEELVSHYLANKVAKEYGNYHSSNDHQNLIMVEVDLNKIEPWDLPETARVGGKEWYFYSLRDRKYATGVRRNRATASGYWKATGKDRHVTNSTSGMVVGMRKTLVFYQGRAPRGRKTDWVMHEFRLENHIIPPNTNFKDWVLCRVLHKKRSGNNLLKQWRQDNSSDDSDNSPPYDQPMLLTGDDDQNIEQTHDTVKNLDGFVHQYQIPNISNVVQNMMSTDQPTFYSPIFRSSEHISMPSTAVFPNLDLLGMGSLVLQYPFGVEERISTPNVNGFDQLKMDESIGLISRARAAGSLESSLSDMRETHIWNRY